MLFIFKKAKNKFVFQLDGDVYLEKSCLEILFNFIKNKEKVAVAPRYTNKENLSNIYKFPKSSLLRFYHWLINSNYGYSPGKISLSGFNYSDENNTKGFSQNDWLSGLICIDALILFYPCILSSHWELGILGDSLN